MVKNQYSTHKPQSGQLADYRQTEVMPEVLVNALAGEADYTLSDEQEIWCWGQS